MRAPCSAAVLGVAVTTTLALLWSTTACTSGGTRAAAGAAASAAASGQAGPATASSPVTPSPPAVTPTSTPTITPARPAPVRAPAAGVSPVGSGHFAVVPGRVRAPGHGTVRTVRVEVEGGVAVDPEDFAEFVMATLNDARSWGHGGVMTFARTDGSAQVVVRLASPTTSAALCRPLVTYGRLSCSTGAYAILTSYRWLNGQPEFYSLTQYRQYVVNHEVGHVLGHGHLHCAGPGALAPVMQQQTKGVAPCRPNAWPFP